MERRGQAAMEFLMTYGWAILAAVIAIAVLAYFGVFSPSKYIPNTCQLTPPLGCNPDLTNASGTYGVDIRVINGGSDTANLTSIALTSCGTYTGDGSAANLIEVGAEKTFTVTCSPVLTQGSKYRGTATVVYSKNGVPNLQSTGSVTTTVLA